MRVEASCSSVREELSARLDGEANEELEATVDEHLATCSACRKHEERLWQVRRAVRAQAAGSVPDLSGRILARISDERRAEPRRLRRERVRYAFIGAAASAVLLLATSLPWSTRSDSASAASLVAGVRSAARTLDSYQATFTASESGWHASVPERLVEIDLSYVAPEQVAMTIEDLTAYPSNAWPRNNVTLVSDGRTFSITEPSTCPPDALPDCAPRATERRRIANRQPFDGIYRLPTDAILPLTALASEEGLEARGTDTILGRRAHVVALPYRQALPLVEAFQPGGSWRRFHPSDEVEVWLDEETWFPLAVEVRTGRSPDRAGWAIRNSYRDRPGEVLLRIEATSLSEARPAGSSFSVPANGGSSRNGGFRGRPFSHFSDELIPRDLKGLEQYRAGTAGRRTIMTWAGGMSYLKLVEQPKFPSSDAFTAEELRLPRVGPAYYLPASERDPRRVTLFTADTEIRLESNLTRADLIQIASSIDVRSRRASSRELTGSKGVPAVRVTTDRLRPIAMAPDPGYMPPGYEARVGLLLNGPFERRTLTVYYRRAEAEIGGFGIRITRSIPIDHLDPSSEDVISTTITSEIEGRWSVERSELEWIDEGTYTAIAVPGFDRATALRIARSL